MALTIDELNIQIEADSKKATIAIDALIGRLESLQSKMSVFTTVGSSFSKTFGLIENATQKAGSTTQKAKNSFDALTNTIKTQENELKLLKSEYASYVLNGQQSTDAARDFATEIKNLSDRIEQNKQKLNNAQNETNKLAAGYDNLSNSAQKSGFSFTSLTNKLVGVISKSRTLYGAFKSLANTMGSWFNESNDYIETLNLFEVAMGDNVQAAKEYAETVQGAMGIDSKEWMNYQAIFQNLATGFGVASDSASVMSQNLTQLSYDLSSIYNTDVETAFDKLSSAMSGQVKGLREFGIDTTVATLQEYALSKGIDASVRSMSQAEKSMLRYNYIMEQSRDLGYWNDMAKTIITPANSLRILTAQITQMKRAFGNIISVVATQVIPYVQAFVELVTEGANKLATLFGFELPDLNGNNFASGFANAEENAEGVEGSLKKIKKQLMGFDELNIISNPDTDSSGSSAGTGGALGNMDLLEYDFLKGLKVEKLDEIKEKMKDILWCVGEIALGLLAWKLSKTFLGSLGGLTASLGLVLIIDSIRGVLKDGLDIGDILKGIIGGGLLGASIGFKLGGWPGALGGAFIGIGITLLIEGITSMFSEGVDIENVATTIAGALLSVGSIYSVIKMFNKATPAATPELQTATDTIEQTSTGTSALTGKLKTFATNMGWGILIIAEVAVAVGLFVAAIWGIGLLLQQVIKAWEPVIDNSSTVNWALLQGTAIFLLVGAAAFGLGTAGGVLAGWIGIGIAIIAEIVVATGIFIAAIWGIGLLLQQVIKAWEPVLANAKTVEYAIETGTKLLVGIGIVTAALGAATVATGGALPLAIALGTAMLAELTWAFIEFVDNLISVADKLKDDLHPALDRLNGILPDLSDNMEDFTDYMKFFAGQVVDYTKNSAISGFSATVDSIIKFFTKDPIKSMANDAKKQYDQSKGLNEKLRLANPELETAISLVKKYYSFLEELEKLTEKTNNISLASGMFVSMKEVGKNLVTGFVDGIKSQNNTLSGAVKNVLGDTFSSRVASDYGYSFGRNLGSAIASGFRGTSFPTLRGSVEIASGTSDVSLKLRAYALGGFPDMGEMFIAREAGPELVGSIGRKTAVANNDQIISGIESGVYRAMVAANSSGNSGGTQTIRIINEIDGDKVSEKVIKYHNSKVMQTGVSPLLV